MKKLKQIIFILIVLVGFNSCRQSENTLESPVQVAFMADVHLQDIYGELSDSDYKGLLNPTNGKYVLARSMQSQLKSTRIYNENYFAFLAALDDVAKRGIKYVVMPGDFSDDGQPLNVRGLKKILEDYKEKYGLRFILTTGNHDPVRPFTMDAGKKDFLGKGGKSQAIMSRDGLYTPKSKEGLPTVVSKDIRKMGYEEIMNLLKNFGFTPDKTDLYWETPFSNYSYGDYNFPEAKKAALFENRQYKIEPLQSTVPDVSYLVEPEEGIWFLAIDGNVYVPKADAEKEPGNASNYNGASIGYNKVLSHKKHLIDWVKSVTERAEKLGKKLVVFSHYPMIDFNDDASDHIRNLMGDGKMQLHRVPEESVAKIFSDAGVKVHFGGHMHINDTGYRKYEEGKSLVNIQIPSLAAYIPAYKIANFGNEKVEIETVVIDSVPRFKELFLLYEQEYNYLESINSEDIWNKDILLANTYHEFTNWHLKELVRLRFLKKDWPKEIKEFLLQSNGMQLAKFAGVDKSNADLEAYRNWTGFDLIFDFYRLRSADKLAIADIGVDRIQQYQLVVNQILKSDYLVEENNSLNEDVREFAHIFDHFLNGAPADHFLLDLKKGSLMNLPN